MLVSVRENRRSEDAPAKGCRLRKGAQAKRGCRPKMGAQAKKRCAGQEGRRVKKGCADREGANQERVRRRREGVKAKKGGAQDAQPEGDTQTQGRGVGGPRGGLE